ncbi:MAG: FHA domain-containing protein [Pseudobutyrivibrio sp.]|uniref:FHA domain-containing protein n=1 Tax=Pseudobutyrivibrio sp. TaxID=2014367 RepID=UPI0025D8D15A|nr:FHA domain-containing protein [Pseudobutyrivibrio sp.]MBQ6463679.1 FHA domain-containing protein [Pseudobutyrivibrio sp.]
MNTLNIWMMIVGLELLLVIVVIIIGVLLILRNKNGSDAPREAASDVKKVNSSQSSKKTEKKNKSSYTGPQYMNIAPVKPEYSDATTILSNAALNPVEDGATTVLGAAELSNNISLGTLTRKKTNEEVKISKNDYSVGKDSINADYCISDNRAISRQHLLFTLGQNGVYVKDCNSTNGSWINGIKLESGRQVLIKDGDVLKLANEEFVYGA